MMPGDAFDIQAAFNIVFMLAIGMGGWIFGRITRSLDKLDEDVRGMPEKYVLKADLKDEMKSIHEKLDKITDALNGKADK